MTPQEELALVERARYDSQAFVLLYEATYASIFSYIARRCNNYHLAQDLTSETYLKSLKKFHQYKPQPEKPFIAWLYTIATNEVNAYFRKQKRYRFISLEEFPELANIPSVPATQAHDVDIRLASSVVQKSVEQLELPDQELINLRFFEHNTIAEIALKLDIKEGTVKSRLSRLLKKIRTTVQRKDHPSII